MQLDGSSSQSYDMTVTVTVTVIPPQEHGFFYTMHIYVATYMGGSSLEGNVPPNLASPSTVQYSTLPVL